MMTDIIEVAGNKFLVTIHDGAASKDLEEILTVAKGRLSSWISLGAVLKDIAEFCLQVHLEDRTYRVTGTQVQEEVPCG